MNSWPFGEFKRQVEYKAAWEGVPVITLTVRVYVSSHVSPEFRERIESLKPPG
jgi:transposase